MKIATRPSNRAIKFWTDNWCSEDNLASILDLDPANLPDADIKVSEFITPKKQWDTAKLRNCLPNDLIQRVQSIPLPYTDVAVSFCWGYTGSGDFSTKSATWMTHDNIAREQPIWQYKWL